MFLLIAFKNNIIWLWFYYLEPERAAFIVFDASGVSTTSFIESVKQKMIKLKVILG